MEALREKYKDADACRERCDEIKNRLSEDPEIKVFYKIRSEFDDLQKLRVLYEAEKRTKNNKKAVEWFSSKEDENKHPIDMTAVTVNIVAGFAERSIIFNFLNTNGEMLFTIIILGAASVRKDLLLQYDGPLPSSDIAGKLYRVLEKHREEAINFFS